jgi:hypothetical protein
LRDKKPAMTAMKSTRTPAPIPAKRRAVAIVFYAMICRLAPTVMRAATMATGSIPMPASTPVRWPFVAIISCKRASMAATTVIALPVMAVMGFAGWKAAATIASTTVNLATTATPMSVMVATPNVAVRSAVTIA